MHFPEIVVRNYNEYFSRSFPNASEGYLQKCLIYEALILESWIMNFIWKTWNTSKNSSKDSCILIIIIPAADFSMNFPTNYSTHFIQETSKNFSNGVQEFFKYFLVNGPWKSERSFKRCFLRILSKAKLSGRKQV